MGMVGWSSSHLCCHLHCPPSLWVYSFYEHYLWLFFCCQLPLNTYTVASFFTTECILLLIVLIKGAHRAVLGLDSPCGWLQTRPADLQNSQHGDPDAKTLLWLLLSNRKESMSMEAQMVHLVHTFKLFGLFESLHEKQHPWEMSSREHEFWAGVKSAKCPIFSATLLMSSTWGILRWI